MHKSPSHICIFQEYWTPPPRISHLEIECWYLINLLHRLSLFLLVGKLNQVKTSLPQWTWRSDKVGEFYTEYWMFEFPRQLIGNIYARMQMFCKGKVIIDLSFL